jgi:cell division control protein 12
LTFFFFFTFSIGESGLGKTTFINTLFTTSIKDHKNPLRRHHKQLDKTVEIEITKAGTMAVAYRFPGISIVF